MIRPTEGDGTGTKQKCGTADSHHRDRVVYHQGSAAPTWLSDFSSWYMTHLDASLLLITERVTRGIVTLLSLGDYGVQWFKYSS